MCVASKLFLMKIVNPATRTVKISNHTLAIVLSIVDRMDVMSDSPPIII